MCIRRVTYHKACTHADQTIKFCQSTSCFAVDLPLTPDGLLPIQIVDRMTRGSNGKCRKCCLKKIDPLIEDDLYKRLNQEREICIRYNQEKSRRPPSSVKRWLARPRIALVYDGGREEYETVSQYLEFPVVDVRCLSAEDSVCAICFENYRNDNGSVRERCIRLPCGHIMGETCADGWLGACEEQPQLMNDLDEDLLPCPFCRHPLILVQHDYPAGEEPDQEVDPEGSKPYNRKFDKQRT